MTEKIEKRELPTISKKDALKNWSGYDLDPDLIDTLIANNFVKPTQVQSQSLVFLN
jgi:superfamily II DNA/RNA helicase